MSRKKRSPQPGAGREPLSVQPAGRPLPATTSRTRDRLIFGGLLLWTFLSLCYPLTDFDFWWHLKTGEWILKEGWVPQVDMYTFIDLDNPPEWIDLHWGFQLLVTFLYRF